MRRNGLRTVGMILALFAVPPLALAQIKIGFVDLQQVISQSKRGQAARAEVAAEASRKQKEVDAREEEIKKLEAELQKHSAILSDQARKEKEELIRQKLRDLRRTAEDFNRDLAKREGELVNELLKEISAVVQEYGKEKGYMLILERQQAGVLYSGQGVDLTQEIIQRFDAKKK